MKLKITVFGIILAIASSTALTAATLNNYRGINAKAEEMSMASNRFTMEGSVYVRSEDKFTDPKEDEPINAVLTSTCSRVVLDVFPTSAGKKRQSGTQAIKSAAMDGPVKIEHTSLVKVAKDETNPTGQITVKVTATSDRATFDGQTQMLTLLGNVKIVREDPRLDEEPLVLTGTEAKVNLGTKEPAFSIKSAEIDGAMKKKDEQKTK